MTIDITKNEAHAAAELIGMNLFDVIRNDTDIDSLSWLRNVLNVYDKLCKISGYKNLCDSDAYEDGKDNE